MPSPRRSLVCVNDTPYYHCVSRCVRRAFLCGRDTQTGQCYEHRRGWLEERIRLLSSLFAIDICAYAVMSNHYHIVVKINSSQQWSDQAVIARWLSLYQGPLLVRRAQSGIALNSAEQQTVDDIVAVWRQRLQDLSWFMKCLNEPIARMANQEDHCTGHFWEARFKSHALRTERALLSCMAYVDLNPVRAGIAESPETSDYTSVQTRICSANPKLIQGLREALGTQPEAIPIKPLLSFKGNGEDLDHSGIPFTFSDYLQLVDWTGRLVHQNKKGFIAHDLPPILTRLKIPVDQWLVDSSEFERAVHHRFRKVS